MVQWVQRCAPHMSQLAADFDSVTVQKGQIGPLPIRPLLIGQKI